MLGWLVTRLVGLGLGHLKHLLVYMFDGGGRGLAPLDNFALSSKGIKVVLSQDGLHDQAIGVLISHNKGQL